MKILVGYIQTNGINTFYKILGEGEPIIVVHGGPGMAHNYLLPKFKRLAKNFKVIFYDQRACGKTSGEVYPKYQIYYLQPWD
jgi:proline iminopeptidase